MVMNTTKKNEAKRKLVWSGEEGERWLYKIGWSANKDFTDR